MGSLPRRGRPEFRRFHHVLPACPAAATYASSDDHAPSDQDLVADRIALRIDELDRDPRAAGETAFQGLLRRVERGAGADQLDSCAVGLARSGGGEIEPRVEALGEDQLAAQPDARA